MYEAEIVSIVEHAPDTRSLFLRLPAGQRLTFKPGQFLSLLLPVAGKELTRAYSIASSPEEDQGLEICLNLVPNGLGSQYLFERSVGETLRFTGPWGAFVFEQLSQAECVFIADRTGVAAIRPMLHRALLLESQSSVQLLYGTPLEVQLLYRAEWEALARASARFRFLPVVGEPSPEWQGLRGSLLAEVERRYVRADLDRRRHFYICGIGMIVTELRDLLRRAGYERRAVHYEKW
jgi:ferredoxin-NADP reductase